MNGDGMLNHYDEQNPGHVANQGTSTLMDFVASANADAGAKQNRGNYRCSKCDQPKKGHVCAFEAVIVGCIRCGRSKIECTCAAVPTRTIATQCEMDSDMTTSALDLPAQGVSLFNESVIHIVGAALTSSLDASYL